MQTRNILIAGTLFLSCIAVPFVVKENATVKIADNEPAIGAAYSHGHSHQNSVTSEPLKFGALVGSDAPVYIELGTDGSLVTNSQSPHTYIGDFNKQKFAGNPRYLIQPGRLKLNLDVPRKKKHVLVKFSPDLNLAGATLSRLDIKTTDIANAAIDTGHNFPNEVKFEVLHSTSCHRWYCWWSKTSVMVDLSLYGKLELEPHIRGEVNTQFVATIQKL